MHSIIGVINRVLHQSDERKRTFALFDYECDGELKTVKLGFAGTDWRPGDIISGRVRWNEKEKGVGNLFNVRPAVPTLVETVQKHFLIVFNEKDYGISPAKLRLFLDRHGIDAFAAVDRDPELLVKLSSNPRMYRNAILREYESRGTGRKATGIMEAAGLTERQVARILDAFKTNALGVLKSDPYRITELPEITFDDADNLGRYLGVKPVDARRLAAAVEHMLKVEAEKGSTCAQVMLLISHLVRKIGVTQEEVVQFIRNSVSGNKHRSVVLDISDGRLMASLRKYFEDENTIASGIARMLSKGRRNDRAQVEAAAEVYFKDKRFDDVQKEAVVGAVTSPLFILTGGPGTGKSTVMKSVVELCRAVGDNVIHLAAPTGQAARRLHETTGEKTSTAHRMLNAVLDDVTGVTTYRVNEGKPLPSRTVVVIDEVSMMDVEIMAAVFRALPPDGRLILVGDKNQLPSVGPGAVLKDMLEADFKGRYVVPSVELRTVYRTAENSKLAEDAFVILDGEVPEVSEEVVGGVAFHECEGEEITAVIEELVKGPLSQPMRLDGESSEPRLLDLRRELRIFCPQAPGTAGIWEVNALMQRLLNPNGKKIPFIKASRLDEPGPPLPRVGDRIVLTGVQNDESKGINNGDTGEIIGWKTTPGHADGPYHIEVKFDSGVTGLFPARSWRNLALGYATSIHKGQGSQCPVVILPLTMAHRGMLDRTLLYTGWTRAEKIVYCVGEKRAFTHAIESTRLSARTTRLQDCIKKLAEKGTFVPQGQTLEEREAASRRTPVKKSTVANRAPASSSGSEKKTQKYGPFGATANETVARTRASPPPATSPFASPFAPPFSSPFLRSAASQATNGTGRKGGEVPEQAKRRKADSASVPKRQQESSGPAAGGTPEKGSGKTFANPFGNPFASRGPATSVRFVSPPFAVPGPSVQRVKSAGPSGKPRPGADPDVREERRHLEHEAVKAASPGFGPFGK